MSTAEVKLQIFRLIDKTNDVSVLKQVSAFLSKATSKKEVDWYDELSDEQKESIEIGLAQSKRGEVFPIEDVLAEGRAIYKK